MSGPRTELYVYYRVAQPGWRAALQAVLAFQQRLRSEHPGLATRVLRRSAERGDSVTLMEIYSFDAGECEGLDLALQAHIEAAASALAPWLVSPRQVETFETLD